MFRPKSYSMKIWRIKDGDKLFYRKGYRLAQKATAGFVISTSFRTKPKFSWEIEAFLKESGLDSIQVVNSDGTISLFDFSHKHREPSFQEYWINQDTVDLLVPRKFECDWEFNNV